MYNKYTLFALLAILTVLGVYIANFYLILNYELSDNPEHWGQLGDYFGGILNPTLTFISIALLIKSLSLQNHANKALLEERKIIQKTEKIRSFEIQLFNMLDAQRKYFDAFYIDRLWDKYGPKKYGTEAFIELETKIEELISIKSPPGTIIAFLEEIDPTDRIYGVTRTFSNMVKLTEEKLSISNEFTTLDRESHYRTIISFTDFALLRLIMMAAQFLDYQTIQDLKANTEFSSVLADLELSYELY